MKEHTAQYGDRVLIHTHVWLVRSCVCTATARVGAVISVVMKKNVSESNIYKPPHLNLIHISCVALTSPVPPYPLYYSYGIAVFPRLRVIAALYFLELRITSILMYIRNKVSLKYKFIIMEKKLLRIWYERCL